jgi:hypothetical protein
MRSHLPAFVAVFVVVLGLSVPVQADYGAGRTAFNHGDYAAALREWRPLAEQGHATAQFWLGYMYNFGRGVAKDDAEAVKWYRKAAEQGEAQAQFNLSVMYEYGRGVAKDDAEAVRWYRKVAAQEQYQYQQAHAQFELGRMYHEGRGVAQDDAQAVRWYRKAAEQGGEVGKRADQHLAKLNVSIAEEADAGHGADRPGRA